ncbi:MarR family winged helix-turn-helix transcriptional regulator [Nitratireductor sp. ZSWI3]|uniref:MarR family winged helix-turn-helix transcriptional regulator n=1 Tax=Nitratireductor sp. ZSWI3 TaxID=2966359 RepID=UPI00215061D7|nr:MarR family winged helix-turn-helix transcriptional regulator [Nitratireductor sp. ZSWI3]MCR4268209.1 MarR family winged helix-turn-helix transcriptional regulator [Nitratireductor sp. ZSWI3]
MTRKPDDETVSAWIALARAHRLAMSGIEARLKAAGLPSLSWYDVLWELEKAGEDGLRPFELERALLFEQYNLSRLMDRMVKSGLVDRCVCPDDRRGQTLRISTEGRALRHRMWAVYGDAIAEVIGGRLSAGEAQALAAMLGKLG